MQVRDVRVGYGAGAQAFEGSKVAFLRKVYSLFTLSVAFSAAGALVALHAGASASRAFIAVGGSRVAVPPLVAYFGNHYIIGMILMIGAIFGASMLRHKPVVNVIALFGMATLVGVILAPALFFAQIAAGLGGTISASPVRDAFLLAVAGFAGLTAVAVFSKRDFSFLGGALTMGLFVLIGASLINLFLGSAVFGLALSSVAVLLFGAYVLYDTSRILRAGEHDPVGGAISLYVDFLNIFMALLHILSARRE